MSYTNTTCEKCGENVGRFKFLKKCNGGFFCKKCIREKRLKHREFLKREVLGISKRKERRENLDIRNKEAKQKKKEQSLLKRIVSPLIPKIKSIKIKPKISALGLYITKIERQVLYKKFIGSGLSREETKIRVDDVCKKMQELANKLRETVKTQEELNVRFKEEFARLVEQ